MNMYEYIEETSDAIEQRSNQIYDENCYSFMFGYMQSHMKYVLNALETTLTEKQIRILNMELDSLKRRVEFGS